MPIFNNERDSEDEERFEALVKWHKARSESFRDDIDKNWPQNLQNYFDLAWIEDLENEDDYIKKDTYKWGVDKIMRHNRMNRGSQWQN